LSNIITKEDVERNSYCAECSHEWCEHTEQGCSRDYCSCPFKIIDDKLMDMINEGVIGF